MTDREREALLLDHNYDGIQEFDNPLPNWWLVTFYGAIIFSVIYIGYYHFAGGPSLTDELAADLKEVQAQVAATKSATPAPSEQELLAVFNDAGKRAAGKQVYTEKCAACHGVEGQGMIGPNLTDNFWIHGDGSLGAILKVVNEGVADKGMPPWGPLLSKDQLEGSVAYVRSLKGTKPANPKEPQGTEVKN